MATDPTITFNSVAEIRKRFQREKTDVSLSGQSVRKASLANKQNTKAQGLDEVYTPTRMSANNAAEINRKSFSPAKPKGKTQLNKSQSSTKTQCKTTRMAAGATPSAYRTTARTSGGSRVIPITNSARMVGSRIGTGKLLVVKMGVKPPPRIRNPAPGMAKCHYCHRNFTNERLPLHMEVCEKMATKNRKIFDASKQRVQGTAVEAYLKKHTNNRGNDTKTPTIPINNWRIKHKEFIDTIRSAKKMQAYVNSGGKLSDLPPPPPSLNPDYIQCPHCKRRFNQSAAERHIPKCANMLHNKPRPKAKNVAKGNIRK